MKTAFLLCVFACIHSVAFCGVVVVAGGGEGHEGPANQAKLTAPFAVDFDASGNMYIAEMTGERIRKVAADGNLTTVAGTGKKGFAGDGGPASSAQINGAHHLLMGPDGRLLIADTWNNR